MGLVDESANITCPQNNSNYVLSRNNGAVHSEKKDVGVVDTQMLVSYAFFNHVYPTHKSLFIFELLTKFSLRSRL